MRKSRIDTVKGEMDMKEFNFLASELDTMKENGTFQELPIIESLQGSTVKMKGKDIIQLSSNNYLGLTSHPRLQKAAEEAVKRYGAGTGSVRTIAGTFTMHDELERSSLHLKILKLRSYSSPVSPQIKAFFQAFLPKMISSSQTN